MYIFTNKTIPNQPPELEFGNKEYKTFLVYKNKKRSPNISYKKNISLIISNVAQLLGQFFLSYPKKKVSGYFTLVFIKSKGRWLILSDHTSSSN